VADNKPRLGNPFKTSVYKYPRKNKDGKTWYYKTPYTKMVGGKEEYNKAVKKITEAYKEFVKKNKFLPNQTDLIEATGENRYRVELIARRKNLKLSNKRNPTLPKPDYGPNQAYLDSINVFLDKDKEAEFIKDLRKMYSYPINSSAAKAAGVLTKDQLNKKYNTKNITKYINKYANELGLERPTQTYEGEQLTKIQANKERKKLIKQVSGPYQEGVIRRAKFKSGLDLAHRSSLLQNKKLGLKYLVSDLGLDPALLNQEIIVPTEQKLESLYKKQNNLRNKGQKFFLDKNKKIPNTLSKAIEDINKKITDVVYSTNGRLNGIVIDEKTLKPGKVGIDYSKVLGSGLIEDKPVKDLTQADMDLIKANLGPQIENETQVAKNLTRIYESGTKKLRDSFDKRIGCKTGCFVKKLNEEPEKIIRLFRGEAPSRSKLNFGDKRGTYFTPQKDFARHIAQGGSLSQGKFIKDLKGKVKRLDIPEKLYKELGGNSLEVNIKDPELLKQAKTDVLQTAFAKAEALTSGVTDKLKWDNVVGAFTTKDGDIASQADIKTYAAENPMEIKVGEEPVKAATNKSVLGNVGKALARVGAPLPTALLDSYFIGQQIKEGKGTAEIASNPLNWLGLATMEPLSKAAGIAEGGVLNKALRLGLNPATIRGITRFAGLPGLAISTALTAYDQYQKYKDGEGFIFNLLNQKGTE
jgi:hypothetical protein